MRIVISDCDHDSFAPQNEVTDPVGAQLVLTQSHRAAQDRRSCNDNYCSHHRACSAGLSCRLT
jgi:hypothetical protein